MAGGKGRRNQSEREHVAAFWIVPPVTLGTQSTHAHTWPILGSSDARFPSKYMQGSRYGCMTRCSFYGLCQHPLKTSSSQEGALSLLDIWAPHLLIPLMTLCLHHRPSEIPAPRQSSQSAATHPIWGSAPTCSSLSWTLSILILLPDDNTRPFVRMMEHGAHPGKSWLGPSTLIFTLALAFSRIQSTATVPQNHLLSLHPLFLQVPSFSSRS